MNMRSLNLHPKLIALPLAVMLLLNMLPVAVYAADGGVSNPGMPPVVDSGAPASGTEKIARAAEEIIDTSTWDTNFIAALKSDYPELFNGANLLKTEVESLTVLNVAEKNIKSLAGIEYFISLNVFECNNNDLTALDVSNNPALIWLNCGYNNLTGLDVSNNPALEGLECENNNLTALDISSNPELVFLDCGHNNLTALNLSNNTKLASLYCLYNKLTALELPNSAELTQVDCQCNNLTALDISNNPALTGLYCELNNLSALDVSNNPALTRIDCNSNNLSALDVSNNSALTDLNCDDNNLTALDVSNNPALTWIDCSNNNLSALDVSNNPALTVLNCGSNNLSALDVSNNLTLTYLACGYNNLTSLDVSQNTAVNMFSCVENPIQHLVLPTGEELTISIQPSNGGSVMLTWKGDGNDAVLPTKEVAYLVTPTDGYFFDGWTGDVNSSDSKVLFELSGNMTVTANFSKAVEQPDTYTVTFQDWDGTTLKTETVNSGEAATAPEAPIRTGYTFTGWDQSFDVVTSDLVVTAQYTQKTADEILEDAKELDPSDTEKVEDLEEIYKSLANVSVNVIADPNTHGNFKNNIDAIQVVGAAFNAEPNDTVMLHFSKPANNVTIDGTRYKTNSAVQLDIKLLKNSVPMQDLVVPVTITVPIPTGVAEKDFWVLHYHNDGSLERIRPTVNGDGTCTFVVNRFSVFAFVNAVDHNTTNNTSSSVSGSSHTSRDHSDGNDTSSSASSFTALLPNKPAIPKGTLSTQQAVSRTHAAVEKAKLSGAAQAIVRLRNMETLTPEAAQAIVKAANGFPVEVQADSTLNNGTVNVRLSFDPVQITNVIQLAAFIDSAKTKSVRTLFNKYFENDIQVVRFEQKGDLGIPVNIAVKLDTKLRGKALYFYCYNQTDNAYTQIAAPQYWINENGYVHFTTKFASCIVISDGPLMRK